MSRKDLLKVFMESPLWETMKAKYKLEALKSFEESRKPQPQEKGQ